MALSYPWRYAIRITATAWIAIQTTPFCFPALFNLRLSRQLRGDFVAAFASTHPGPSSVVCRLSTVTCSPRRAT